MTTKEALERLDIILSNLFIGAVLFGLGFVWLIGWVEVGWWGCIGTTLMIMFVLSLARDLGERKEKLDV